MRTLLAVAGFTLALGIAPVAEEALSRALRALVDAGSQKPCSMAAGQSSRDAPREFRCTTLPPL
jgi:hypothetical protein